MKILNLYAGIGGNRKLWGDEHEIVAVEYDNEIAEVYKQHFPQDKVIVDDAHEFLLNNYKEFDFIWSSPPCPSHSSFRQNIGVRYRNVKPIYPDMSLYEEIIFLQYNFDKLWVVENVIPYYKPLIEATKLQRHLFWSNFNIEEVVIETDKIRSAQISQLQELHKVDLSNYKLKDKRKILRNCVHYKLGKHILECAINELQQEV